MKQIILSIKLTPLIVVFYLKEMTGFKQITQKAQNFKVLLSITS